MSRLFKRARRRRRAGLRSWWSRLRSRVRTTWIVRTGWALSGRKRPGTRRRRTQRPRPSRLPLRLRILSFGGWRALPWRGAASALALAGMGAVVASGVVPGERSFRDRSADEVRALPVLPALPIAFEGVALETYVQAWVPWEERDALLRTSLLRDREFARRVHWWLGYWTGGAARWFPDFLTRMAWHGPAVDSALAAHGLPPSLRYLPLIESGYAPDVTSRATAVGLWQLMAPTARGLGLEVSRLVDERRHIEKSTDAALRYLADLNREFESWHLTLAAYNSGPTRVRSVLRRYAPDAPRTDSLFWALRHHFAPETRDFLPKLYSAMWIASRPHAYGFETPTEQPLTWETVRVPDRTTLDVVADAAGVDHADIVRLNPEFVQGMTPPGRRVTVKVPAGHRATFERNYPRIPEKARVTFVEHVVRPGETLSKIALLYGVGAGDLEAANPEVRARSLAVGARLTVPLAARAVPEPAG